MATNRKPTLKQLFTAWKKYQKKADELRSIKSELDKLAEQISYSSELIRDGDYLYRVRSKGYYGSYEIQQVASIEELKDIQ
jgi:mRNA-degrading endonuclease RelE of RelBE toxin-antitoxin system